MKKIKNNINKYKNFFIPSLITIFILIMIYAIKGIYPFGNMTIAQGDIGQSYIPFYHFLYDVVYNGKSIFYDYTLGMGSNMYGRFIIDGLLNPSAWIVLLGTRENIPYMLSFVLMIKVIFISFTSYLLFNKLYKKNTFYNIIFSVLYAFSGYVLMYNSNIMWLDVVGLFPLFILAIKYMFETNKIHWYSIILALMLIFNYNIAYMIVLFVIMIIPIYIKFAIPKEKRKKAIFNLFIATGIAIGLSAFAILPSFVQVMNSYRMSGSRISSVKNINILFKVVVFCFYILPIYGFCKWVKFYTKDRTNVIMYGIALIFTAVIPILFEKVNLKWHMGSYQMFPFRYGFIPILILYMGALRYFSLFAEMESNNEKSSKIINVILFIVFIIINCIGFFNVYRINSTLPAFIILKECFFIILMLLLIKFIITKYFIETKNKRIYKKIIIFMIILSEIFMYGYAYIGVPREKRYGREWSDEEIFTSYEIEEKIQIDEKNNLYRLKDLTELTTENCSLVYNVPSIATFMHIVSSEQVINYYQMGYSQSSTKLNDYGGTIFSDAIYGIKYVLSKQELSDRIYNYIDETSEGIKIYEYKNTLPIGITYENEVVDIPENLIAFDAQNYVYQKLFDKQDNIIESIATPNVEIENHKYSIDIQEASQLYIYTTIQMEKIIVNGETLIIPTVNIENNTLYPTGYGNGILDLGTFESETVEIEIQTSDNQTFYGTFGILDIAKYNQIFQEKSDVVQININGNKISITGAIKEDTKLFIPINYDKGWKISKESNQNVNINRVYNNFIGLNLQKGEVNIKIVFIPECYKIGVILTIIAIIILIIIPILDRKINICSNKQLQNIIMFFGIFTYLIVLFWIYVISMIETFIYRL